MKFYSDDLQKLFDSVEELNTAEAKYKKEQEESTKRKKKLAEERKARAHEIEVAYKEATEANKKLNKLRSQFIEDYGSYHMTIRGGDSALIDWFLNW